MCTGKRDLCKMIHEIWGNKHWKWEKNRRNKWENFFLLNRWNAYVTRVNMSKKQKQNKKYKQIIKTTTINSFKRKRRRPTSISIHNSVVYLCIFFWFPGIFSHAPALSLSLTLPFITLLYDVCVLNIIRLICFFSFCMCVPIGFIFVYGIF